MKGSILYHALLFFFLILFFYPVTGSVSPDKISKYAHLAEQSFNSENFEDACFYYSKALSENEGSTDSKNPEILYYKVRLAYGLWNNCETEKAAEIIKSCRLVLDSIDEPLSKDLLQVYLTLAEYYLFDNQPFSLPEKYLDLATRVLNKNYAADHHYYGILYFLKGYYKYKKTDYENARQYFNQSLSITKSFPALIKYEFLNYRYLSAIYYYYESDYDKAIAFSGHIVDMALENHQSPAFFYEIIGRSYLGLNNTGQAKVYLNKAVDITSAHMNTMNNKIAYQAYFHLSRIFRKEDQQAALFCLNSALEAAKRNSLKGREVAHINYVLGLYYYDLKNYNLALRFLQKAIIAGCSTFSDTSALSNPAPGDIRQYITMLEIFTRKSLALISIRPNDLKYVEAALQSEELAIQLIEQWISDINDESSGLFNAELRKRTLNNAVYHAALLYRHTGNRFYADKAFSYAEKSKMQVLLINTLKKEKLKEAGVPDSLIRRSIFLENAILNCENRIALDKKNGHSGTALTLTAELTRLFDMRDRLSLELYEKFPVYKNTRYDFQIARIPEVQQLLSRDQAIIEYQLMDHYLITFIITQENFSIYHQMFDNRLRVEIENLRSAVSENPGQKDQSLNYRQFISSSNYLYCILIKPIYEKIRDKRLIIIPSNDLSLVPFEVLVSKGFGSNVRNNYRDLPFLIREFPMVYAYSASFLLDQKGNRNYGSGTAVFLPDYANNTDMEFQNLDGARTEAALINRIPGSRLFSDDDASEKQFREQSFGFRVLHIASHALVDEEQPNLSCLVMSTDPDSADDGLLHAFEVRQLKLNAQLVVLSGCNTGYGKLRLSEGLVSLARSFFYTGVRTVAFTLWEVADKSGAELIKLFYRGLRNKESMDIAMRNAKLYFIDHSDPVRTHPYYWANYTIVGNAEKVPLGRLPFRKAIFPACILVMVAIYMVRRKFISGA